MLYCISKKLNKDNQKAELLCRIKLDRVVFDKIGYILRNKTSLRSVKVFEHCVLPVVTYCAQTWILTKKLADRLIKCQKAMVSKMLYINLNNTKTYKWVWGELMIQISFKM